MSSDVKITVRIPPDLHGLVVQSAEKTRRSLNALILVAVEEYLQKRTASKT